MRPTLGKIILTVVLLIFIEVFFSICSPLEYHTSGEIGSDMGFHTYYTCGLTSQLIGNLFGSSWTNPSPNSYWFVYLLFAYLLSCIVIKQKKTKRIKNNS